MSCCFKTDVKVIGEGLTASLSTEKILSAKVSSLSAPLVASINKDCKHRCFFAALNVVSALKASVKVLCISPDGPTPPVPPTDQMWWLWDSGAELMWDSNVNVIYE